MIGPRGRSALAGYRKVNGFANHVDLLDGDAQRVAKAVFSPGSFAHKAVALRINAVVVVAKLAQPHQSLAGGFGNFDKDAPVGDTRNYSVKGFAYKLLHIHGLHVLHRRAFCVGCILLPKRTVLAELLKGLGLGRRFAVKAVLKKAVHQHIRVSANRRGKMGIVVKGKAVVPHVGRSINGLGHGPHGKRFKHVGFGRTLDLTKEFVDGFAHVARAVDLHLVAERTHELAERNQLHRVGMVVNAVNHSARDLLGLCSRLFAACKDGYLAVGEQHKLLNELVGILGLFDVGPDGLVVGVEAKLYLSTVKTNGTVVHSRRAEGLGHAVHAQKIVGQRVAVSL